MMGPTREGLSEAEIEQLAARLAANLNIVSQATQYDDPTTLLCRRRPGRKPCWTLLSIIFDLNNNDVLWCCPRCHDEGRIAGWENTFWDNGILEPEKPS